MPACAAISASHSHVSLPTRPTTGLPAVYQPASATNASEYILPYHTSTLTTSATCMPAPTMDYPHDIGIWAGGRLDAWNTARGA